MTRALFSCHIGYVILLVDRCAQYIATADSKNSCDTLMEDPDFCPYKSISKDRTSV